MTVEPCASIIAACLPTLGPLFKSGQNPGSLIQSIRSVLFNRFWSLTSSSSRSRKDYQETVSDIENDIHGNGVRGIQYGQYSTHVDANSQHQLGEPGQILVLKEANVEFSRSEEVSD